ncbi:MAG: hypothetical protein HZB16_08520 [Armatimonadetes bacterium]|nr:hypothetical protein [Armatimonadota bacterium]
MTNIDPDVLIELGEWAALGFYEGLDLPWPRSYGLALRRLYEHLPVTIAPDALLHPVEPLPTAWTMTSHGHWYATALIVDADHNRGLRVNRHVADDRRARFPHHAQAIDALVADLEPRLPHFGGYTHSNPDMRRVVHEGFEAMAAELADRLAEQPDDPLLLALTDYAAGVLAFWERTREALAQAALARPELAPIAAAFARCFRQPATSFLEGLLAVNFTWMLDFCDSIGRFDQVLGPLFEADLAAGRLDLGLARRLLDELWQSFERLNGWNLQLGGRRPDGADGCNALTLECIDACQRNKLRRPNVALRLSDDTPPHVLRRALVVLGEGSGRPALYNDDLYIASLLAADVGLTVEDAREIGFGGCTETMIAGLSNVGSLEAEINLAVALERALRQPGAAAWSTIDDAVSAVQAEVEALTEAMAAHHNAALTARFAAGDPKLPRTFFTRDCVARGLSFEAGGARYNWAVVSYQGIANVIDSLAAIEQVVFADHAASMAEVLAALAANFEGHEPLRRRLAGSRRFGNDVERVDQLGAAVVEHAWRCLRTHRTPRGGRYLPSCILFATYGDAGSSVGATPDGRLAGTPLNDSVGPVAGRDTHGPTAMLASVAKLPLHLAVGTPVLNLRAQHALFESSAGLEALAALVRGFFERGGPQIQLTVVDRATLLAAQAEPERYADLIVRIGGYSEYFTRLGRDLQETVIARTEHGAA